MRIGILISIFSLTVGWTISARPFDGYLDPHLLLPLPPESTDATTTTTTTTTTSTCSSFTKTSITTSTPFSSFDDTLPTPPQIRIHKRSITDIPQIDNNTQTPTVTKNKVTIRISNVTLPLPPTPVPTSPPSPIPTPLDTSISYSLSTSCLLYLTNLLSTPTFIACLPLSLLLTTSSAYSSIVTTSLSTGNYTTLNNLLAYTINPQPSITICDNYMSGIYSALSSKSNCATDLTSSSSSSSSSSSTTITSSKNGNGVVALEALIGVGNYETVRKAAALTDEKSGAYCYLEAVQSVTPDDLYLWSLPAGISLPSTFSASCSKCSASLLNTFISQIPTTPTLNATIIKSAVSIVNSKCGSNFVVYNVVASGSDRVSSLSSSSNLRVTIGVLLFVTAAVVRVGTW